MKSKYKAMVLSCIDPRFQPIIFNFLQKKKLKGKYSFFSIAGSSIGVTAYKFRNWHKTFWDNLNTSIKLHKISKLIIINHEDCGAAKIIDRNNKYSKINEIKIHSTSFNKIRKIFKKKYKKLKIETYFMFLNGKFKKFN